MNGNYEFNIIISQEQINDAVRNIVRCEMETPTLSQRETVEKIVQATVADILKHDLDFVTRVEDIAAKVIGEAPDAHDIAAEIDLRRLAERLPMSDLASEIDIDDLAGYFNEANIADRVAERIDSCDIAAEIDLSDLASHIHLPDLAEQFNYRRLAEWLLTEIDRRSKPTV